MSTVAICLLVLFIFLGIGGLINFFLVLCFWPRVEGIYREWIPKVTIAAIRFISCLIAFFPHFFPLLSNDQHWLSASIAGAVSWLFWEITAAFGDFKSKDTGKKTKELEKQGLFRTKLLTTLRRLVNLKSQRIKQALLDQHQARPSLVRAREALAPPVQLTLAIQEMAFFLRPARESEESFHQNFRVGLYREVEGFMEPWIGFDLKNISYDPFTSFNKFRERFSLANETNPAEIVKCINENQMRIVSDCNEDPSFSFFDERQRNYLRSLVCFPIMDFVGPDGRKIPAALVIDTDIPGHFKEDDRLTIFFFMEEFSARLKLEALLIGLIGEG